MREKVETLRLSLLCCPLQQHHARFRGQLSTNSDMECAAQLRPSSISSTITGTTPDDSDSESVDRHLPPPGKQDEDDSLFTLVFAAPAAEALLTKCTERFEIHLNVQSQCQPLDLRALTRYAPANHVPLFKYVESRLR
jgi:hypothetical protein